MEGCTSLPLTSDLLSDLNTQARDYLVSHGVVVRTREDWSNPAVVMHAPVTLLPSPVPRRLYAEAQAVQNDINLLLHRVSCDREFLHMCLHKVIEVDDFTRNLWNIYDTVLKEGVSQPCSLGLNRSDYMFDRGAPSQETQGVDTAEIKLRQIEVNLMASSFGGLAQQLDGYHRFILQRMNLHDKVQHIPANSPLDVLAEGMVVAWQQYGKPEAVILFLVDETERNVLDQRHLEYGVYRCNPKVKVIRRTLKDIQDRGRLTDDKLLMIDELEVCVFYQRHLYSPTHYTCPADWATRLLVERSRAIKCPSAAYHLAGTKKIQQVLAQPGMVEKFISDPQAVARIRGTFAGQYNLDQGEEGDKAVAMAMENPHLFVLKPQREGGGNNTFGEEIRTLLKQLESSSERSAYILMDHIHPAAVQNYMLLSSDSNPRLHSCVSELGIFGAFVGTSDRVILNRSGGHILRTKTVGTNEGGVATGHSCMDSPYIID